MHKILVTISGNGTLPHNWGDVAPPTTKLVDAHDQQDGLSTEFNVPGTEIAATMVFECEFMYAHYYGDVGFDGTSDLMPLSYVRGNIADWLETERWARGETNH